MFGAKPAQHNTLHQTRASALDSFASNGEAQKVSWDEGHASIAPSAFPTLPSGLYYPRPRESIVSWVPHAERVDDSIRASAIVQLSWALVIASFTDSTHVSFGLQLGQSVDTPSPVLKCTAHIKGECTVGQALASKNQTTIGLISCCNSYERECQLPNLLVICDIAQQGMHLKESSRVKCHLSGVYALSITATILQRGIQLHLRFDPDVLSKNMGQIVLDQLAHIVTRIGSDPKEKLKNLYRISPNGLQRLQGWHFPVQIHRKDSCIHEVITKRCSERLSAPAICAWDGDLTYSELETLSANLAQRLVIISDQPEEFVGLFLGKSVWTAVSILSIMKAGKAFVLLDPSLPDQRLRTVCQISRASMILTSSEESTRAIGLGPPLVIVQSELQQPHSQILSLPIVSPHQPAYAAFTSGSSGEPKGVVVDHSAVCSGVDSYCESVGLNARNRVFQFASYSFTISVVDHLIALMRGACLCIPSPRQLKEGLTDSMVDLMVDWVTITPSVARTLEPNDIPTLRTLCLAGESLTRSDLDKWLPYVDLKSVYGQSENTLAALVDTKNELSCPCDLGYAFSANCWIVSSRDHNCLLPIGAEGELLIEASTMAQGYLNNEKETQLAFIKDPSWLQYVRPGSSGRFLKTGDIVRWRPENGSIQYVGRSGTQNKLRGQRIELAEVEIHLRNAFPMANTVVAEIVTQDKERAHDALLVAFIGFVHDNSYGTNSIVESIFGATTTEFSRQIEEAVIKLRKTLPGYMIPTSFLPLNRLPLTPSGKLNRRLLRIKAADLGSELPAYHTSSKVFRRPSTDSERSLQRLCANILQLSLEDINMDSTFFEIGGTSISAMQLVHRASESGLSFSVTDVYRQDSLAVLARRQRLKMVESKKNSHCGTSTSMAALKARAVHSMFIPINTGNIQDIFPCTETQQWMLRNNEGGYFLLHFSGKLDVGNLKNACRRLLHCHTALRSVFVSINKILYQVVLDTMEPVFPLHSGHRNKDLASTARALCKVDEDNIFPLGIPPLEFTLVSSDGMEHILVMRLSHAQYDGICQHRIVSDLCEFYEDLESPGDSSDFALYAKQINLLQTPEVLNYWQVLLEGSTMTSLPFSASNQSPGCTLLRCSVEVPTPEAPSGISLATLIKASWSYVLRQFTGNNDIVFGQLTNLRGMDVSGIYRTVGPCYNILPVRVQYQSLSTAHDLLLSLQGQHTQSIPFQAAEWNNICQSTGWPSDTWPQSIFIHQHFPKTIEISMDGLRCRLSDYIPREPTDMSLDLYSDPQDGKLILTLISSDKFIKKNYMETALENLCTTISQFASKPGFGLKG